MVNFPIQIGVFRRDENGVETRATHYEGSCNTSDVTGDASADTITIPQTPEDAAGGSAVTVLENRTIFLFDEKIRSWRKYITFQG